MWGRLEEDREGGKVVRSGAGAALAALTPEALSNGPTTSSALQRPLGECGDSPRNHRKALVWKSEINLQV